MKGKNLLRVLFTLNGFFYFRFLGKLGRIVRVFVMMLPGFYRLGGVYETVVIVGC